MWFKAIIREETGCAAYMIGCQSTGECAVFHPLWDIHPYQGIAKKQGSTSLMIDGQGKVCNSGL